MGGILKSQFLRRVFFVCFLRRRRGYDAGRAEERVLHEIENLCVGILFPVLRGKKDMRKKGSGISEPFLPVKHFKCKMLFFVAKKAVLLFSKNSYFFLGGWGIFEILVTKF